ncbi:MAG: long-chain fatty acid--CoA ligase, partial [Planctomycetes bacterium]|nr:long-chain fatty acid--CoA ligase [Planctomycetota bacterium]
MSATDRFPEKDAVIAEEESIDYRSLSARAERLCAAMISAGLKPGDRVVLYLENSIDYVAAYFGTLLAGGVVVGQASGNRERQLKNAVNHCRATGIVTKGRQLITAGRILDDCPSLNFLFHDDQPGFKPEGDRILFRTTKEIDARVVSGCAKPVVREHDLAQIIYTSGTTAEPKGVMLTHRNLCANTESIGRYLGLTDRDRVMVVLPFYYSYGNSLMLTHIACAGSMVLDNRFAFPEKVLGRMAEEKVTGFSGVPSTFAILVHRAGLKNHPLPALRHFLDLPLGPSAPGLPLLRRRTDPADDLSRLRREGLGPGGRGHRTGGDVPVPALPGNADPAHGHGQHHA